MPTFKITPHAHKSLQSIGRYTLREWGKEQRDLYLRKIDKRFHWLADNPNLGRPRPDIEDGYYCYQESSHLIFYTIETDHIAIIGIPHKKMDIVNYFHED